MMVGRLLFFWDGIFSGAMLNFQGVMSTIIATGWCYKSPAASLSMEKYTLQRGKTSDAECAFVMDSDKEIEMSYHLP